MNSMLYLLEDPNLLSWRRSNGPNYPIDVFATLEFEHVALRQLEPSIYCEINLINKASNRLIRIAISRDAQRNRGRQLFFLRARCLSHRHFSLSPAFQCTSHDALKLS